MPDYSWEELLSHICLPFNYLMTITLEMLVPLADYRDELSKIKTTNPVLYDRLMAISTTIVTEIILPIVEDEYASIEPITQSDIQKFMRYCSEETGLLSTILNITETKKLNLKYYEDLIVRLEKQQRLSENSVQSAIKIVKIMIDYMEMITVIIQNRKLSILKILKDVDYNDLINSIYGTMIAIFCINTVLAKKLKTEERFSSIVEAGYEFAKNLDGYSDTLDILTSPEELELFRKTDNT